MYPRVTLCANMSTKQKLIRLWSWVQWLALYNLISFLQISVKYYLLLNRMLQMTGLSCAMIHAVINCHWVNASQYLCSKLKTSLFPQHATNSCLPPGAKHCELPRSESWIDSWLIAHVAECFHGDFPNTLLKDIPVCCSVISENSSLCNHRMSDPRSHSLAEKNVFYQYWVPGSVDLCLPKTRSVSAFGFLSASRRATDWEEWVPLAPFGAVCHLLRTQKTLSVTNGDAELSRDLTWIGCF